MQKFSFIASEIASFICIVIAAYLAIFTTSEKWGWFLLMGCLLIAPQFDKKEK